MPIRLDLFFCLLLVASAGCLTNQADDEGNASSESSHTYPYPTLPHSAHFEPKSQDSLFFAVSFRLPERGRLIDEQTGGTGVWNNAQAKLAVSHRSSTTSGHLKVEDTGSTFVGTNCPYRGDLDVASCPRSRLEAIAGSKGYSGGADAGNYVSFIAYYGADEPGREKAVMVSADSPIEESRICEGSTRLFFTSAASPGDFANQTVSFHTDAPAYLELESAPGGGYPRRLDVRNESGLVARYVPLQDLYSMQRARFIWNETVTGTWTSTTALGVPAGNWTIDALLDVKEDGVSAELIGVLDNPCFVAADGTLP